MLNSVRPAVTAIVAGIILSPANAQTWSGNGGNGSWNNAGNWVGSTIPSNSNTTAVVLTGTSQLATTQDIANPFSPREVGFFVPPAPERMFDPRPNRPQVIQSCDCFVDAEARMYVTDSNAGLYILQFESA